MNSEIDVFWVSTKCMLADEPSRKINFNEEFLLSIKFREIESKLNVKFDIDLMATSANTKCKEFIGLHPVYDHGQIGTDFFAYTGEKWLRKKLYIFPPKNIITKALRHIFTGFTRNKIAILMKVINEFPPGFENCFHHKKCYVYALENEITIIPSEKKLLLDDEVIAGDFNKIATKSILITLNLKKSKSFKLLNF